MTTFKKVILTILCIVLGAFGLFQLDKLAANAGSPKNYAKGFDGDVSLSCLRDERGVFEGDEESAEFLDKRAKKCAEKIRMNVMLFIAGSDQRFLSDSDAEKFSDDLYDDTYGEYTDGVIFYLDLSGKSPAYDFFSKSGRAMVVYNDSFVNGKPCEKIFNAIDSYLPHNGGSYVPSDIRAALEVVCEMLEEQNDGFKENIFNYEKNEAPHSPVKYAYIKDGKTYLTKKKAPGSKMIWLLVSEFIGFLIGFISYFVIKSHYKFKTAQNPSAYVSREHSRMTETRDDLVRSYVTKHKIESSSGGGGHRGGGGGFHGGGSHSHSGHHR